MLVKAQLFDSSLVAVVSLFLLSVWPHSIWSSCRWKDQMERNTHCAKCVWFLFIYLFHCGILFNPVLCQYVWFLPSRIQMKDGTSPVQMTENVSSSWVLSTLGVMEDTCYFTDSQSFRGFFTCCYRFIGKVKYGTNQKSNQKVFLCYSHYSVIKPTHSCASYILEMYL